MKKNILIIILFSISILFTSCGQQKQEETTETENVNKIEQVVENKNNLNAAQNGVVQKINAQIFKEYIFDYQNNSVWKLQSEL
ncbi:MAG: hypothetical protein PHY85_09580, partial [Bacteroidales bacterium]|nr:hypothetical protein [Bacteroidales bacterium]